MTAPEPPFWAGKVIAPYSSRRATPLAIDYIGGTVTAAERLEVQVCDDVTAMLDREAPWSGPALVDAAEMAEAIFGRGDDATRWCLRNAQPVIQLISSRGSVGQMAANASVVLSAWPPSPRLLEPLFEGLADGSRNWGLLVPVIYPATTALPLIEQLVQTARSAGARFVASTGFQCDAAARRWISQMSDEPDEVFDALFHRDLEPLLTATERHIAALAHERGMFDFITPPDWPAPTNWNAAVELTRIATRMLAMEEQAELAGEIARSARIIAGLEKPITRIAEAASLSIIEGLNGRAIDVLTHWLQGATAPFASEIEERWRLRRNYIG